MKCKRDGCDDHDVSVGMETFPYCTNLCAAIDVPAPASLGTVAADTEPTSDAAEPWPTCPVCGPCPSGDSERDLCGHPEAPWNKPYVPSSPVNIEVLAAADEPVLPTDSDERKEMPIFSGVMNYFPLALAAVARISKRGNDQHNPGEPLGWVRGKSMDQEDCIARHLIDIDTVDPETGEYDDAARLAWRALAALQIREEKRLGKPWSRGSR